jgi:hypothetical protein
MKSLKRTYALPSQTLAKFEHAVAPGKRSTLVASLMEEWLAEQEREALRRDIVAGCEDMWDIYLTLEKEWHPLEEEVACALES